MRTSITARQIVDSIEQNGYLHVQGTYVQQETAYDYEKGEELYRIRGACAIGQAVLNLGLTPIAIVTVLNNIPMSNPYHGISNLTDEIIRDNDTVGMSLAEIVAKAREILDENPDLADEKFPIYDDDRSDYSNLENYQGVR